MKITPIAGAGVAGVSYSSEGATPNRKEAAKQAFLGNSAVKINPSDLPPTPEIQAERANIRSLRMNTNATPGRMEEEELRAALASETPPDPVDQSQDPQVDRIAASKPISPQLAELARQRRALAKEREALRLEKASTAQSTSANSIELSKIKETPLEILKKAGVTYEELTNAVLAEGSGSFDANSFKTQLLEEAKATLQSEFTQRDVAAEQQVLKEIRREADQLVAQSGEEFEMIKANRAQSKITDLIHRNYKATGEVMDVQEAAKLIEDTLLADTLKVARLNKVQSQLTPSQQAQVTAQRQPQFRTLTNRQTAVAPMSPKARAIAAFYGTLKK